MISSKNIAFAFSTGAMVEARDPFNGAWRLGRITELWNTAKLPVTSS